MSNSQDQNQTKAEGAVKLVKGCPFCGALPAQVHVYLDAPGKGHEPHLRVACLECGSGAPSLETWNARKGPQKVVLGSVTGRLRLRRQRAR